MSAAVLHTGCAEPAVAIALYDNEKSRMPAEQQVSGWESITGLLTKYDIRSKKSGRAFAPHRMRPGASRSNDGVISLSMLVVDSDKGTSFDEVAARFEGFHTVVYTTHSHTPAINKVRAVLPLSEEAPVEDWKALLAGASDRFGADIFDPTTKDPARLYYLPSCPPENVDYRRSQVLSGQFLDPRPLIDRGRELLAQSAKPSRLRLDITGSSDRVQFPFSGPNAARYLEAAKAAYPNPDDYETFRDLLFECAELVVVQEWPESEVKQTYDWVSSQAVDADRSNNDKLWTYALERTRSRVAGGMACRSHRSTFDRAHKNGWKDITVAAKACLPVDTTQTLNDAGNADRFVSVYRPDVRYVTELSAWIVWRDGHWRYTTEGQILEQATQVAKSIYAEAADAATSSDRNALGRWANSSLQLARLKAMVELAKAPLSVSVNDLDADPMLLGVRNGVVELKTGTFRRARRDDLITKIAQVEYVPGAECPVWQAMLHRCMGECPDLVGYLQRIAGYCLTGLTAEQKFFFLHGSGANGKSTFVNVLREIIGDYARQAQTEVIMVSRNTSQNGATPELVRLAGARLVCMVETEEGQRLAESRIKQMTGGDAITARALHCAPFEFVPIFKLLLSGNHRPVIRGDDAGIWRRIELIPFTVTIPPEQQDRDLLDRLRSEYSGILNWMIRGCVDWLRIGLNAPIEVTRSVAEYRSDMDLIGQWIDERCEIGAVKSLRARVGYSDFVLWLKSGGHRDITETRFALKLSERGYIKGKDRNGAFYQGLGLRQSPLF